VVSRRADQGCACALPQSDGLGRRRRRDTVALERLPIAATITRCLQHALDRAELPRVRFHALHHSAATFLLAQGMTVEDVGNQLGHSTIVLTSSTYGHVLEQRQRQVARAMDAVLGG
jgi:integrase